MVSNSFLKLSLACRTRTISADSARSWFACFSLFFRRLCGGVFICSRGNAPTVQTRKPSSCIGTTYRVNGKARANERYPSLGLTHPASVATKFICSLPFCGSFNCTAVTILPIVPSSMPTSRHNTMYEINHTARKTLLRRSCFFLLYYFDVMWGTVPSQCNEMPS